MPPRFFFMTIDANFVHIFTCLLLLLLLAVSSVIAHGHNTTTVTSPTPTHTSGTRTGTPSTSHTLTWSSDVMTQTPTNTLVSATHVATATAGLPPQFPSLGYNPTTRQCVFNHTLFAEQNMSTPEAQALIRSMSSGSQAWNPYGFGQRRSTLFPPQTKFVEYLSPTLVRIQLAEDPCHVPRGKEEVIVVFPFNVKNNSQVHYTFDSPIVVREDISTVAAAVGAVLVVVCVMCALIGVLFGVPLYAVHVLWLVQLTVLVGRTSCAHPSTYSFVHHTRWVVFPLSVQFGEDTSGEQLSVTLLTTLVVVWFLIAHAVLDFNVSMDTLTAGPRSSLMFPSVSFVVCYVLMMSAVAAGSYSVATGSAYGVAMGTIIIALWVVGLLMLKQRLAHPPTAVFRSVPARSSSFLHRHAVGGVWGPRRMIVNSRLFVDATTPLSSRWFPYVSMVYYFASAIVLGVEPTTFDKCWWQGALVLGFTVLYFNILVVARPYKSSLQNIVMILGVLSIGLCQMSSTFATRCPEYRDAVAASAVFEVLTLVASSAGGILVLVIMFVQGNAEVELDEFDRMDAAAAAAAEMEERSKPPYQPPALSRADDERLGIETRRSSDATSGAAAYVHRVERYYRRVGAAEKASLAPRLVEMFFGREDEIMPALVEQYGIPEHDDDEEREEEVEDLNVEGVEGEDGVQRQYASPPSPIVFDDL